MAEGKRGDGGKFVSTVGTALDTAGTDLSEPAKPDSGFVDPAAISGDSRPVKSGVKAGSKRGPYKKQEKAGVHLGDKARANSADSVDLSAIGLGDLLFGIHEMLALCVSCPELALDKQEAARLGDAAANVAKHYDMRANPKIVAWAQLGFIGVCLYGPRIGKIAARQKKPKPASGAAQPDNAAANGFAPVVTHEGEYAG